MRFREVLLRLPGTTGTKLPIRVFGLAAVCVMCPALAFDTFWHSAATSAATRQFGFTDDSTNIVQFGNFGPDYFGPLYDSVSGERIEYVQELLRLANKPAHQTMQDFDTFRRGQTLSIARKYAVFFHFDNLHRELDQNWKFDYLFDLLLKNTKGTIRSFHSRADLSARRRQMLILMTLGASLHMVQDFYSHSDWTHNDFAKMNLPLFRMPWGKDRAPTWFEVRARLGPPDSWPFRIATGVYPPPKDDSPNTHAHLNHDNSQLFYDNRSQVPRHGLGPVPACEKEPKTIAEHQLFAVNTAAGASIEWMQKLMEEPEVRAALNFARVIKLARTDPMVPYLTSALGSTLFLSCLLGNWDGKQPPQRRRTECRGIFTSLIAPTADERVGIPPVLGRVGAGMAPTPRNEFWAMHVQHNLFLDLGGGFGAADGHYMFDDGWRVAHSR